jgi:hypothetical protein
MFDTFLVPEKTAITAKGDGPVVDIGAAQHRVFLLRFGITGVVEQESIDLSVLGAAVNDDKSWGAEPLLRFPQKFYPGEYPLLLDLAAKPDVKFLRARWDVNRWGRGSETPFFEVSVRITEVAPEILRETQAVR